MSKPTVEGLRPVEVQKRIQPAKYNYGTVEAGGKVKFKFILMPNCPEALGFERGCGCQGEVVLTDVNESGEQILTGEMELPPVDRMEKGYHVQNYEQYIDVYFTNGNSWEYKEEGSKEIALAPGVFSVRLWVSGSISRP